ncbi:hypothetical protein PoB_000819300 [Plakobranchus ocellatus]|uniref:Uncharacterized protein n=1 Tax=Plakobranchus ocellatus TaxID=259542 RepID=A0AAV3YH16_9GAST|nr:hypothetical protein PoB_000819300 [Plakobranchus ocellatus]
MIYHRHQTHREEKAGIESWMRCMHLRKLYSYKIARVTFMRMFQISSDSVYRCDIHDKGSVQNEVMINLSSPASPMVLAEDRKLKDNLP